MYKNVIIFFVLFSAGVVVSTANAVPIKIHETQNQYKNANIYGMKNRGAFSDKIYSGNNKKVISQSNLGASEENTYVAPDSGKKPKKKKANKSKNQYYSNYSD